MKIYIEVEVPDNFAGRLDMQPLIEEEIKQDRWLWKTEIDFVVEREKTVKLLERKNKELQEKIDFFAEINKKASSEEKRELRIFLSEYVLNRASCSPNLDGPGAASQAYQAYVKIKSYL